MPYLHDWFNREAVLKVRDTIAKVPAANCNMGEWLDLPDAGDLSDWPKEPVITTDLEFKCGTVACIAGYAALQTERAIADGGLTARFYDEQDTDFTEIGAQVLGLDDYCAERIFRKYRWPSEFKILALEGGDQRAMVALLDAMLDFSITYTKGQLRNRAGLPI